MINFNIDKRIKIKNIEDILELPKFVLVNKFTEDSVKLFRVEFGAATKTEQPVIPVIIDSYGGLVDSLLAMVDIIRTAQVPVATIVSGKAMSCGSCLLSCGTEGYRYVGKHARVLIHPITGGAWGNDDDIKVSADEIKRLGKVMFRLMAKNCGHPRGYFLDKMKEKRNADWILSPKDCIKHNLAQHIGTPTFRVSINSNVEFCM